MPTRRSQRLISGNDMKFCTIFCVVGVVVVAIAPLVAAGEAAPITGENQSIHKRNGPYAQRLPRLSRLQDTIVAGAPEPDAADEQTEAPTVPPPTIDGGFVILEGRYIAPPYAVRSERGAICINGLRISQRRLSPFPRRPSNMPAPNRRLPNGRAAQIEQHLREEGLLIGGQGNALAFVSAYQAVPILEILLGDEPVDAKIQKLVQTDTPWIASEQWASLAQVFDGPSALSDRVQALKQRQAEIGEDDTDLEPPWLVLSGITFSGFILAVCALGILLSCRPPMLHRSRATVLSKSACRQVIWLVVLIAVLNMYDLTCTLFAHNAGGLWELNPFASPIVHQNAALVVFKLSLTVGAATLLLVARRNKLAQMGSWWAGILYTVLILRWTMFNSMFL
jgi:hypothetical protein